MNRRHLNVYIAQQFLERIASDVHVRIDRRLVAQSNLLFDLLHEAKKDGRIYKR